MYQGHSVFTARTNSRVNYFVLFGRVDRHSAMIGREIRRVEEKKNV